MKHSNSELQIRIVEKEEQYKEVRTQVESMRVTYEKHQRELNERLERTVQENSAVTDLQRALDGERLRVDELQVRLFILVIGLSIFCLHFLHRLPLARLRVSETAS